MIKFFRAIRQNLLNEGKTTKYFKYAIGEIVLVVIGILIALQINNWNQDRQVKQKEREMLIELKRDLTSNDNTLQNGIEFQKSTVEKITAIIEHLKHKKPFNDTISLYLKHVWYPERIQFVSSAYESLKSVGIDIISSGPLREDIAYLFGNEFPFVTMWLRDAGQQYIDAMFPYYIKFFEFTDELSSVTANFNPNETRLSADYENLSNSKEFVNVLSMRKSLKRAVISRLTRLQERVKKTIESIDKELESFD